MSKASSVRSRNLRLAAATLLAGLFTLPAGAGTLDTVKQRGTLQCGVSEGVAGFSDKDAQGNWRGRGKTSRNAPRKPAHKGGANPARASRPGGSRSGWKITSPGDESGKAGGKGAGKGKSSRGGGTGSGGGKAGGKSSGAKNSGGRTGKKRGR